MGIKAVKRSLLDFKRHPWLHTLSILTITISLLILGVFFLSYRNFTELADRANPQIMGSAYLQEGLNEFEIFAVRDRILSLSGVDGVEFKTKDAVLEELNGFYGGTDIDLSAGHGLFPNLLEVRLNGELSKEQIEVLSKTIASYPEVTDSDFSQGWFSQFHRIRDVAKIIGLVLMAGLLLGCSFLIANFMGMRHQARRRDIEIIQLMGATRRYVFLPFLYEGLLEGVIGVALAIASLFVIKGLIGASVIGQWTSLVGMEDLLFLSPAQTASVISIGIVMALVGSITVFLRFQDR